MKRLARQISSRPEQTLENCVHRPDHHDGQRDCHGGVEVGRWLGGGQVVQVVEVFRGTIVDVDHESVTVQGSGSPEKLDAMLEMLKPFGILEMVRTGQIALARGGKAITDGSKLRLRRVV
jgi:acetolactate synthase small subunit